ncbi:hypothetical protein N3K66_007585 [Trichothecium roseum]|uniref:Uncharacterized protein n=1 Tax=Trichothecium roseum TaxID=47278 RepID=A0ACC0UW22_9HYPO|nr:hypothetical protein N3K66_007585 [Trichothecium roseum]
MKVSAWMLSTLLLAAGGARAAAAHQGDNNNGTKSTATITSPPAAPTVNVQGGVEDEDSPSPYADYKSFTSAILNSTNTYRAQHNASSLTWNATLASFASSWISSSCKMSHSGGPYGENLAIGYPDPAAAVRAWGDERASFDFRDGGFSHETGHFTQLVWRSSRQVGCGRRDCGEGKGWYVACEYLPVGNVRGHYREEVLPQISGPETGDDDDDDDDDDSDDGDGRGGGEEEKRKKGTNTAWVAGVTIICYGLIGLVVFAEWSPSPR